jgi:hypothetical protein
MSIEPQEAQQHLRIVQQAQARAEHHSVNNGVVLMLWGVLIIFGLALFDLFSGPVATGLWAALAALGTIATGRYASRLPVQPQRTKGMVVLLVTLVIYYPIMLIGGILLFGHKPFLFTTIGVLTALPLLIAGGRLWVRSRGK